MASRKRAPDTSRLTRSKTIAYARKQKGPDDVGDGDDGDDGDDDAAEAPKSKLDQKFDKTELSQPIPPIAASDEPTKIGEPAPSKPPAPAPVDDRAHIATTAMPPIGDFGALPEMPTVIVPASSNAGAVEDPTNMPAAENVPGGSPEDPAAPPGVVPQGDSRSLRRRADRYEFALIYRQTTFVISRTGTVGTRGVWRVVEYPTSAAAATAYAKECSRFVSEGFTDYRG